MLKFFQKITDKSNFKNYLKSHIKNPKAFEFLRFIGPGLLVTVGFTDPGNWASNVAAGADYGYKLLWMVTLSTIMLIILQHNSAHLGIATGYCLAESATIHMKPWISRSILASAMLAAVSTALAELLGGAIALNMLFRIPLKIGALMVLGLILWLLFTNSYQKLERWIIGFVSIIGLSFLYELSVVNIDWGEAAAGWVTPSFPEGSMIIIMSVLGAVVMPHNLYLHSEVIQSRQWNLQDDKIIEKQLKYEFLDTLLSMGIGWAINSAMIIIAAATFFANGIKVTELNQAQSMLTPLIGSGAGWIFAIALLFSGISSAVTAGMTGGSISAGMFKEPYDIKDKHSRMGVMVTLVLAALLIFFIQNPFNGLVYSQMLLSIQLPITIFTQIYLTSKRDVMGKFKNSPVDNLFLWAVGLAVTLLNILLFINYFAG